jgi:hypothetical protein
MPAEAEALTALAFVRYKKDSMVIWLMPEFGLSYVSVFLYFEKPREIKNRENDKTQDANLRKI